MGIRLIVELNRDDGSVTTQLCKAIFRALWNNDYGPMSVSVHPEGAARVEKSMGKMITKAQRKST